ncbi:hypothetical protein [Mycobacterium marinum]|uniref:hypothetical protein n=1 Tax=Mycobacterium marinum TaxID=1781 RepID=UPI003563FC90
MALSRKVNIYLVEARPESVREPYDDQPVSGPEEFCLAALPAWAARKWATRVKAAVCEAELELARITDACERMGVGMLAEIKIRRDRTKLAALQTIALWGADCLSLEQIKTAAAAVTAIGLEAPA